MQGQGGSCKGGSCRGWVGVGHAGVEWAMQGVGWVM